MKKYSVLFLIILVLSGLCGCISNENSPNRSAIKNKDIEARILYHQITNDVNQLYLSTVFAGADAEEEYQKVALCETRDLVVDEMQEDRMICSLCEEKGILVSKKSAQQAADTEYNRLKTNDSQKLYYKALLDTLDDHKISEEKYQDLLYDQAYYHYNRVTLKQYFINNLYVENDPRSLEEQFTQYLANNLK